MEASLILCDVVEDTKSAIDNLFLKQRSDEQVKCNGLVMCKMGKITEVWGLCNTDDAYPMLSLPLKSVLGPGPTEVAIKAAYDILTNADQWDYCEVEHCKKYDNNMELKCVW